MDLIKKILYSVLAGSLTLNALAQEKGLEEKLGENQPKPEQVQKGFQSEVVTHTSGAKWSWEALQGGDYASRTNEIFDRVKTKTSNIVSGGFNKDTKIFSHLGTYTKITSEDEIKYLLEQFASKVDRRILPILKNLLRDYPSYVIIEQFFKDGGTIEAWTNSGRYTPSPLVIAIGIDGFALDVEKKLYHEALHYAFDKNDSILSESNDRGGADHKVILPLEERLGIIQQINQGKIPIYDENDGLYGFTRDGKIGEKIKTYVDNNDLAGLKSYINSDNFQRGYVRSAMTIPLSSNDYYDQNPEERGIRYRLTEGQIRDIAFLNAVNGAIIQQAIDMGISMAREKSMTLPDVFRTKAFLNKFQSFLNQYTAKLEDLDTQPYKGARI